jgi:alpha-glucosidase (family GH31 glycosyl hydrolase)
VRLPAIDNAGTAATTISQASGSSARQITLQDAQAGLTATVDYAHTPVVSIHLNGKPLHTDLPHRSYALDGAGAAHYSTYRQGTLHVGLGEKAAPMDLSGRGFLITASDTFGYDAHRTDPLYKHVPLLINVIPGAGAVGILSTSHARAAWAVGSEIDGLWGRFKVYRQARGGLEEYLIVGGSVAEVVRAYAGLAGFPLLVPRYYLGYVSGGMRYSMLDGPVRAADAIVGFLDKCRDLDIPISAHQMSSGYTVSETPPKTRNVFTWNLHRFPDPRGFTREVHKRGVRILANIKPYVLANHPDYDKLSEAGAFFRDPQTGRTAVARLWSAGGGESGEGSHVDFTSEAGYKWWYDGCRSLKEVGIDAMWNDNNEYNTPNDKWECALNLPEDVEAIRINGPADGDGDNQIGLWGRAANTELMGKSSWQACVDAEPDARPMVLTRSATAGTMKYACASWSGDNVTSWEGMKGSNALALNAGFSLIQCYGHDIGGFEGPQPTPEHLVRWVQMGAHSPRLAINCYKTSPEDNLVGEVIEPWQYPESTDLVRAAIKRRYEILPYIYSLSLKSHLTAVPPQRWTGWGYEADENVWTKAVMAGDTQYWLGDALLVAGAYEPGQDHVDVYLPSSNAPAKHDNGDAIRYSSEDTSPTTRFGFFDTKAQNGRSFLNSGGWHRIDATLSFNRDQGGQLPPNHIPVLARAGSALPVGKNRHTTSSPSPNPEFPHEEKDDWRGVEIYPPPTDQTHLPDGSSPRKAVFETEWFEDDGVSAAHIADVQRCTVTLEYTVHFDSDKNSTGDAGIDIKCAIKGTGKRETGGTGLAWQPLWLDNGLDIVLPRGLGIKVNGAVDVTEARSGSEVYASEGRNIWNIPVAREWST